MDADAETVLRQALEDPAHVAADGQSVTARPIGEILQAADRLSAVTAATKNHCGMVFRKMIPSG